MADERIELIARALVRLERRVMEVEQENERLRRLVGLPAGDVCAEAAIPTALLVGGQIRRLRVTGDGVGTALGGDGQRASAGGA